MLFPLKQPCLEEIHNVPSVSMESLPDQNMMVLYHHALPKPYEHQSAHIFPIPPHLTCLSCVTAFFFSMQAVIPTDTPQQRLPRASPCHLNS